MNEFNQSSCLRTPSIAQEMPLKTPRKAAQEKEFDRVIRVHSAKVMRFEDAAAAAAVVKTTDAESEAAVMAPFSAAAGAMEAEAEDAAAAEEVEEEAALRAAATARGLGRDDTDADAPS